jgi:hypothetical protein
MMILRETKELARSLLAYEAVAGQASELTEPTAVRVCDKLRGPLCAIAGVEAYRSLLTRALTLARTEAPSLDALQVTADGYLRGLRELALQSDNDHASEGAVLLTAQLLGLFFSLLGAAVTIQLVQDVFPNLMVTTESGTQSPFEDILKEVGLLNSIGNRLESLANQDSSVEGALMSVSWNLRNTATALEVLTLIRTRARELQEKMPKKPGEPYLM